jgi:Poly-beta-hydroxybutyrate polymerase (PhaC) N-terminus
MSSGEPPGSEDEALGIVEAGEAIGIPTVTLLLQGMAMTLAQPRGVARETRRLAGDTLRILAGKSDRAPAKGDRRFADPAWAQNPAFRRLGQEYLSLCESVGHLVDDLDLGSRSGSSTHPVLEPAPGGYVRDRVRLLAGLDQGLVVAAGGHVADEVEKGVVDVAVAGQDGAVPGQGVVAGQVRDAPAGFTEDERHRRDVLVVHGHASDDQGVGPAAGHVPHARHARQQEDLPVQRHEQFL